MRTAVARATSALAIVGTAAVIVVALVRTEAPPMGSPALALTAGKGPLELRISRDGRPIVTAAELIPGELAEGRVKVTNSGAQVARLRLGRRGVADSPGPNGGVLSQSLRVRITRVLHRRPNRRKPSRIYKGTLAAMPKSIKLAALSPGRSRTFRVRVKLPDGGVPPSPTTGDNALQGSAGSIDFVWLAKAARPGTG